MSALQPMHLCSVECMQGNSRATQARPRTAPPHHQATQPPLPHPPALGPVEDLHAALVLDQVLLWCARQHTAVRCWLAHTRQAAGGQGCLLHRLRRRAAAAAALQATAGLGQQADTQQVQGLLQPQLPHTKLWKVGLRPLLLKLVRQGDRGPWERGSGVGQRCVGCMGL